MSNLEKIFKIFLEARGNPNFILAKSDQKVIEHKKGTSSSDILLEVLQAPKIIGEWENKIVREELQTLELTCNTVQGNPIPTIRWFKNDYPLGRV